MADEHDLGLLKHASNGKHFLKKFLNSRRQGISPNTILFYKRCISRLIRSTELNPQGINSFLSSLTCNAGGKLAYYRAIRAFCNWLERNEYLTDNPIKKVDPPKTEKPILPSLTLEQSELLIKQVKSLRDKTIISLFADSGMRLHELARIKECDINWGNYTVTIWGKGKKQRKAPFTERSAELLKQLISKNGIAENIWNMKPRGIQNMLLELKKSTGIPCNPHAFRRGFSCNLHKKGLSTLDIMHLGGWEDLSMVLHYTRSITFDDCLEHYKKIVF